MNRNTQVYQEIEAFEDYELTYCCMYEMAIRSPWFEQELKEIIDLYEEYNSKPESEIEVKEDMSNEIVQPSIYATLMDKIIGLGLLEYEGCQIKYKEKVKAVLEIYHAFKRSETRYTNSSNSDTMIMRVPVEKKTHIIRYLNLQGCHIKNTFVIDEWLLNNDIEPGFFKGNGTLKAKEMLNDLIERDLMGLVRKEISIYPSFSRPHLKIFKMSGLTTSIDLDFSLPKHELLSYIAHVKDQIDSDPSLITPVGLLDKELTDRFRFYLLEYKNGQKQIKLATMFYIYDAFQSGMKQSQIKREVSYYNGANIDERTIKDYYSIMKTFIEEEQFKHLTRYITL